MAGDKRPSQNTRPSVNTAFVVFAALLCLTVAQLLLAPGGVRKTRALEAAVQETRLEIAALERRNAALAGEVHNLKHGLEAAEERARADLGMIGKNESFYQIVGSDEATAGE
ncbi:MAG: septum formation initiator family protein [Pseudomonadota bacterium]